MSEAQTVQRSAGTLDFEFAAHHCFACGELNERGLRLQLHLADNRCWTELTLGPDFEGWEGIVHGGILTTILDEVMAWALVAQDAWGLTARLSTDFRKPVRVGQPIRAEGWLSEARRRLLHTGARIVDATSGDVLATATGLYLAATTDQKSSLKKRYRFRLVEPHASTDANGSAPRDPGSQRLRARQLGRDLDALIDDPEVFARALRSGLAELADDRYLAHLRSVAPGIDDPLGVRGPLLVAIVSGLRPAIRRARPAEALWLAEFLSRQPEHEVRHMALAFLGRSLSDDPERTWQLMRRLGRRAGDWIAVDSLAFLLAEGILREPYRWAEIEQLVYAASPWERRLAASTVAVLRSTARRLAARRAIPEPLSAEGVTRGLAVLGNLIGDADPNVRRALSWALRELAVVDRAQVTVFVAEEVDRAAAERDGNRASVLRDALPKLDPAGAARLRARLAGLRRRPRAAPTSRAAAAASRFGGLPDPRTLPEPPL